MPLVKELPVVDQQIVLGRDVLAQVGLTTGRATLVIDHDSITIRPVRDVGHDIDRETLIQKMMEKSGCSREEIERFLATAGAWAESWSMQEPGIPVDHEKFVADLMAKTGESQEEIEAFLDTAGSWADDDETVLTIMRVREEMARWQPPEW